MDKADKGEYEPLVKFIAQSIERSLDIYLKTLTPATQKQEKFLTLAEIAKNAPFSAKYLNLLARQGKLEAHKEGRDWLTSKEAIERYLKNRTRRRKI
ncbi:MAG: helix-turn-helix domain-containing protein [Candidatus Magasanikbacteria bacterium]|nr:helix-turn-helix domain-containing protein [Candidatus Magasanikbacteria bacterium]